MDFLQKLVNKLDELARGLWADLVNLDVVLNQLNWQSVTAILTFMLVVGVILGWLNIKATRRSREAQIFILAIERMDKIKEFIKLIKEAPRYGSIEDIQSDEFKSPWDSETENAAYRVSVELQRLAYLCNAKFISKRHFKKMWGSAFVNSWNILEVWVKHLRLKNGEQMELSKGAFSRIDFEKFAKKCRKKYTFGEQ